MTEGKDAQFEAEVNIGKGMRAIDRNGSAVICDGRLSLRTSTGDVIAEAPLGRVWADKARFNAGSKAKVWVDGVAYTIGPPGTDELAMRPSADPAAYAADKASLAAGRELTQQFFGIVAAEGGHLGRPKGP